MAWTIEFDPQAQKQLSKLGPVVAKQIRRYLDDRIATALDPRLYGKGLSYEKTGLWRYRVGDYRILCRIRDERLVVLVVTVGHRRDIYE